MKKLINGFLVIILLTAFSSIALGADPFSPPGDKINPPSKPLLSPKKMKHLKNKTDKKPGPATTIPRTWRKIAGTIEVFNVPRGGCVGVRFHLLDNGSVVPDDRLFLPAISTGNPHSTGYSYEISGLTHGVHTISMQTEGGCVGFKWAPESYRVRIPSAVKIKGKNFIYNGKLFAPRVGDPTPAKPR